MTVSKVFLFSLTVLLLASCNEDSNGGFRSLFDFGKTGKSGSESQDEIQHGQPEPIKPPIPIDQVCSTKWQTFWTSFRVGEFYRWQTELDGHTSSISEETTIADKDQVVSGDTRADRLRFMDECLQRPSFDTDSSGKDGSGKERISVPAGTFNTEWKRDIERQPRMERDTTRYLITLHGRRLLIKESVKVTISTDVGLETHTELRELVEFKPKS